MPVVFTGPSMRGTSAPMISDGGGAFCLRGFGGAPSWLPINSTYSSNIMGIVSCAMGRGPPRLCALCRLRGLSECTNDAPLRKLYLEAVFAGGLCVLQCRLRSSAEGRGVRGLSLQDMLCLVRTPGNRTHPTQRDTRILHPVAVHLQDDCCRSQR